MSFPCRSLASSEPDTDSLMSQATTTMTIGDCLPAQLVRKSARKGFTFNIMLAGQSGFGKTALLCALFGKELYMTDEKRPIKMMSEENLYPEVGIDSRTFEIEEKKVHLKLTVIESRNYGAALSTKNTHIPLVKFIDQQLEDYHKHESGVDRRKIQDKMIHCLFFFVSPFGYGLSELDKQFLKVVHNRVNVVPIIARAQALNPPDTLAFKRRLMDDLKKEGIDTYQMPDPDLDDSDDMKRIIKDIQAAMPFAIPSISRWKDNIIELELPNRTVDHYVREHSDFLLLKTMLHMQMSDLKDTTHEIFYENYRRDRLGLPAR